MVVEVERHDMRRRSEGGFGACRVAGMPVETGVVWNLVRKLGRIRGAGGVRRGHGRQRLIIHDHQLRCVERLGLRFRHDQRDRLTREAHLVRGQQRLGREGEGLSRLHVRFCIRAQRLQPVGCCIGGAENGEDSRRRAGGGRVDRLDEGMGMRRAQHDSVDQPLECQVVEIGTVSGDKARILAPSWRLAHPLDRHVRNVSAFWVWRFSSHQSRI